MPEPLTTPEVLKQPASVTEKQENFQQPKVDKLPENKGNAPKLEPISPDTFSQWGTPTDEEKKKAEDIQKTEEKKSETKDESKSSDKKEEKKEAPKKEEGKKEETKAVENDWRKKPEPEKTEEPAEEEVITQDELEAVQSVTEELGLKLEGEYTFDNFIDTAKKKIEELEKKAKDGNFASEEIQRLNDYVSNGGDINDFIQLLSWDPYKVSDEDLMKTYLVDNFETPEKEADEYITTLKKNGTLKFESGRLRKAYVSEIDKRKNYILMEPAQRRAKLESEQESVYEKNRTGLREVLSKTNELIGTALNENDRNAIYDYRVNGKLDETLLNHDTANEVAFYLMNKDEIIKTLRRQGFDEGSKKAFDEVERVETPSPNRKTQRYEASDGFKGWGQ